MPRRENNSNNNNFEPFPFPFWDFANHFNVPGQGVDNHNPPPPPPPSYPGGPGPRPPTGPWGHWGGGPGASWAGFMNPEEWGASPWDEYHNHHHHGRHARRQARHERRAARRAGNDEQGANENAEKQDEKAGEKGLNEKSNSPDTMAIDSDVPDPEEVVISGDDSNTDNEENCKECHQGEGEGENERKRGGFCRRGRGGPRGGGFHGRRGGPHSHPFFGNHHHRHPHPHRGGSGPSGPDSRFNFADMMRGLTGNPVFQSIREQIINGTQPPNRTRAAAAAAAADPEASGDESFAPPVDIFNTSTSYVLHIAIPGANKEDIGVNWDPERHILQVTGVVHRPGDEEFINTLVAGERRIGLFDREIRLPPPGIEGAERDEVDGQGISAKMENGLLVVTVPKVEKEWTQVTKVDIE